MSNTLPWIILALTHICMGFGGFALSQMLNARRARLKLGEYLERYHYQPHATERRRLRAVVLTGWRSR